VLVCCDYRLRLQEGFHFVHTQHGILSLAIELDMQVIMLYSVHIYNVHRNLLETYHTMPPEKDSHYY